MSFVIPGHSVRRRVMALLSSCALAVALFAPQAGAIRLPDAGSEDAPKVGVIVRAPELDVEPSIDAAQGLQARAAVDAAAQRFLARYPGEWQVTWDSRGDRPNMISGSGIPLLPGRGNHLARADVGLAPSESVDLATIGALLDNFMRDNADLLKIDGLEFKLDAKSGGPLGSDKAHWFVEYRQVAGGVPVQNAYLFFRVVAGNLVQFGSHRVAPVTIDTQPAGTPEAAFATAFEALRFPAGTRVTDWLERGALEILPYMPDGAAMLGQRYQGTPGAGYAHRLAWRFRFRVDGDRTTYQVLVDAHSLRVIDVRDINLYATATLDGGVYPAGARNTPGTAITVPFPHVSISNNGSSVTDENGNYNYTGGTASTTLNGRYIRISDPCGNPSLSDDVDGNLHLGTSLGTDCSKPSNGSSTHSARNAFFYLTGINRKAASYYPSNSWLDGTVTANVNINDACNAYWDGYSLNFYKAGTYGSMVCANTGELSGVFMHEFGHGIQEHVGPGPSELGTGEATGDTFAFLQTHDGCIGDGFILNSSDACTGVRSVSEYSVHDGNGFVVKPSNITAAGGPDCDNGMSCPYYRNGFQPYMGPMGYEGHCESHISSTANWDLSQELVDALGNTGGWKKMDDLWYAILPSNRTAYRVESGGQCNVNAVVNGCGSNNWYNLYLVADDDDGNLANGTPNACRIWDAFNAHGIACGARPVCSPSPPAFDLELHPAQAGVCASDSASYTVDTIALGIPPMTGNITLATSGLPAGVTASFSVNPVAAGSGSTLTLDVAGSVPTGRIDFTVDGHASGIDDKSIGGYLDVSNGTPISPMLAAPANGASGVSIPANLSWSAVTGASDYDVELASDASFNHIVQVASGINSTSVSMAVQPSTEYWWRVKANNFCGGGGWSAAFRFTTGTAPFPAPYCQVSFPSGIEPITRVTVAGIDNGSAATSGSHLENFTAIAGSVSPGESYPIEVQGNTAGNYTNVIRVFIDWNRNGNFDDAGETYQLTDLVNSTGSDNKKSTGVIAVPASVMPGEVRMRVVKRWSDAGGACNTSGYGQAEDYTLIVGGDGPSIDVAPATLELQAEAGTTAGTQIVIGNLGNEVLDWTISDSVSATCDGTDDATWLSVSPSAGDTEPDAGSEVAVTVDANGLSVGNHSASLCVASNDAVTPMLRVPVSLTVLQPEGTHMVTPSIAGGDGTIDPATPQVVADGDRAEFTLVPSPGFHLGTVDGTCGGNLSDGVFVTDPVTTDCTVLVSFVPGELVFVTQPEDVMQGDTLGSVTVSLQDADGNPIRGGRVSVIDFSVSACGGTVALGSADMVNGVATFDGAQPFFEMATGHVLHAETRGVPTLGVDSEPFDVVGNPDVVFSHGFEDCRF